MTNPASPTVPQSDALAEASLDSLSELFSRDPEGYSAQDLTKVIETYRAMRVKWKASEATAAASPKGPKVASAAKSLIASVSAEDAGL
jgi:hypothetical protein